MAKAWKIKDWGARRGRTYLFIGRDIKDYANPAYICFPVNLTGERFRILMSHPDGQRAYGIFCAMACLAATMPCKGLLADDNGPLTPGKMSARTGIPSADLVWAIDFLSADEIGWLQPISERVAKRLVKVPNCQLTASKPPANCGPEQEQEQAAEQEKAKTNPAAGDSGSPDFCFAARGSLLDEATVAILARFWKRGHAARELAAHPNATYERVCWLAHRAATDTPAPLKPPGFIRKGIVEGWAIDPVWLARFQALEARRAIA